MKILAHILLISFLLSLITNQANAAEIIDLSSSSNYNIRINGEIASDQFSHTVLTAGDLNNNGKIDLIVGTRESDYNSRSNSGALYIIYDDILDNYTGTGNSIDLLDHDNFHHRIDGAAANDRLGNISVTTADMDNDGYLDILVGAGNSDGGGTDSGDLYVIFNSKFRTFTGVNQIADLSDSADYNYKISGENMGVSTSDQLSLASLGVGDIDNDGKDDILVGSGFHDLGATDGGTLYIILNTLFNTYSSQNIDLATSSNYSLRLYGSTAENFSYGGAILVTDVSGDARDDIIVGAVGADFNSRASSGSIYVIYNDIPNTYFGTGTKDLSMGSASNYSLRFDGAAAGDALTFGGSTFGDFDGDGAQDLVLGPRGTDFNSLGDSGSFYVIFNSKIDTYSSKQIDLSSSNNYNFRFDGDNAGDVIGYLATAAGDFDGDAKDDLIFGAPGADFNSRSSSGAIYIIYASLLEDYDTTSTGQNLHLENTSYFNIRFDGAVAGDVLTFGGLTISDLNNDGKGDILAAARSADSHSRTDNGSLYIIYNFPASITLNAVPTPTQPSFTLTGSIAASNSPSNISGVEWSTSNNFNATWTSCTATDGSFNSTSETFTCSVSGLANGSVAVYVRAFDSNGSYTVSSTNGSTGNLISDSENPNGKIVLNSIDKSVYGEGAKYTNSRNIIAYIKGSDDYTDVTQMKVSKNRSFKNISWRHYANTYPIRLADKDDLYTIYVKFRDELGNTSKVYSDTITLDRKPPVLTLEKIGSIDYSEKYNTYYYTDQILSLSGQCEHKTQLNLYINDKGYEQDFNINEGKPLYWNFDNLNIQTGSNTLKIICKDIAGNESEISFKLVIDPTQQLFPEFLRTNDITNDIVETTTTNNNETEIKKEPEVKGTADVQLSKSPEKNYSLLEKLVNFVTGFIK